MIQVSGKYCKDAKIFIDDVEEEAMSTIRDILDCPVFEDSKVRIMPDVHAGKGIVIGFTAPVGDHICPSHVGVDIGCSVTVGFTNIDKDCVDLERLERDIRKSVKFGQEYQEKTVVDAKDFYEFVNRIMRTWRSAWPEQILSVDVNDKFIEKFCARIGIDEKVFWKSLGTVGSGNHYVEVGADPWGYLTYSIHCGSRNPGVRIAKYHEKKAAGTSKNKELKMRVKELTKKMKAEGRQKEIQAAVDALVAEFKEKHIEGYLTGSDMSDYLTDMALGVAYAMYNHEIIMMLVTNAIKKQDWQAETVDYVRSVHNYVDFFDRIIRKGAIRAYKGNRCVIPFNMRDGIAVCEGKSNSDWNCSAPHGAGRVMSRSAAKKNLSVDEFKKQMEGIVSTSVGYGTIDEAPDAYKPADLIQSLIGDTVEVQYVIRPLINLKDKCTARNDD